MTGPFDSPDHPVGDMWIVSKDSARTRLQARRARKHRRCEGCDYRGSFRRAIAPGDVYVHYVLFPGNDIWNNRVPITGAECSACARRYGRGALIDQREARR